MGIKSEITMIYVISAESKNGKKELIKYLKLEPVHIRVHEWLTFYARPVKSDIVFTWFSITAFDRLYKAFTTNANLIVVLPTADRKTSKKKMQSILCDVCIVYTPTVRFCSHAYRVPQRWLSFSLSFCCSHFTSVKLLSTVHSYRVKIWHQTIFV